MGYATLFFNVYTARIEFPFEASARQNRCDRKTLIFDVTLVFITVRTLTLTHRVI